MRALGLLVFSFILAGCAATGPKFTEAPPPANDKAVIYVYRDPSLALGARDVYFYVNGKNVFDLTRKGYSYFYASPGPLDLSAKWPFDIQMFSDPAVKHLDIKPGETRYFRFQTGTESTPLGFNILWGFFEVPVDQGHSEISTMAFQPQNPKTGFDF